jgi:Tol biopolymer transport system component
MAFISRRDGDFEIYLMEPDGSDQKALTDNDTNEWAPAWSPDGTQIAFISDRDGARDLYVMSADGGLAWRLTDEAHPWNDEPAWSPDGRWIAFRSNVGGYVDLYLIAAGGTSGPRQITENAEYDQDRAPAWQPAGVPGAP